MELRIVNENPKYPPVKLIEPTTLGYIHLAAVVQPRRAHSCPWDPWDPRDAQRERSQVKWLGIILYCIHGLRVLLAPTHSSILGYLVTAVSGMCSAVGGLING